MLCRTVDGPAAIQTSGVFTDRLVKIVAGWRFAQRTLRGAGSVIAAVEPQYLVA